MRRSLLMVTLVAMLALGLAVPAPGQGTDPTSSVTATVTPRYLSLEAFGTGLPLKVEVQSHIGFVRQVQLLMPEHFGLPLSTVTPDAAKGPELHQLPLHPFAWLAQDPAGAPGWLLVSINRTQAAPEAWQLTYVDLEVAQGMAADDVASFSVKVSSILGAPEGRHDLVVVPNTAVALGVLGDDLVVNPNPLLSPSAAIAAVPAVGSVTIDLTKPLTLAEGLPSGWRNATLTLLLAADDPVPPGVDEVSGVREVCAEWDGLGDPVQCEAGDAREVEAELEGNHTLKFLAVDRAGNREGVQQSTVLFDFTAPVPVFTVLPEGSDLTRWFNANAPPSVSVSATDPPGPDVNEASGVNLTCLVSTLNGARSTECRPGSVVDLEPPEGVVTVAGSAEDFAGNRGATSAEATLKFDATPPVLTFTFVPPEVPGIGWIPAAASGSFTPTDALSGVDANVTCARRTATGPCEAGPFPAGPGVTTFFVRAGDVAGNVAEGTFQAQVDPDAPHANVTIGGVRGADPAWFTRIASSLLLCTEPAVASGLASCEATIDGEPLDVEVDSLTHASGTLPVLSDGEHEVAITGLDRVDHAFTNTTTVRLDGTKPLIEVVGTLVGGVYPEPPLLQAADVTSGLASLCVDGACVEVVPGAGQASVEATVEGLHTYAVSATDVAGNTATQEVTLQLDAGGPTFAVERPLNGSFVGAVVNATALATDATGLNVSSLGLLLMDVAAEDQRFEVEVLNATAARLWLNATVPPRLVEAVAFGEDLLGRDAELAWTFTSDQAGPALTVRSPLAPSRVAAIEVLAADAGVGLDPASARATVDGAPVAVSAIGGSILGVAPNLAVGSHIAVVEAADLLGNPASVTWAFEIVAGRPCCRSAPPPPPPPPDPTPPPPPPPPPPRPDTTPPTSRAAVDAEWFRDGLTVRAQVQDNAAGAIADLHVRFSADGAAFGAWSVFAPGVTSAAFQGTAEGHYQFAALARDAAGNREDKALAPEARARKDTTPPLLTARPDPAPGEDWLRAAPRVALTASDAGPVTLLGRLCAPGCGAFVPVTEGLVVNAEGAVRAEVKAVDAAGNEAAVQTFAYRVDLSVPTVQFQAQVRGATVRFTSLGTADAGGIVAYEWTFDDGGRASGPEVEHTFARAGFHAVTLLVRDASGNEGRRVDVVDVDFLVPTSVPATEPTVCSLAVQSGAAPGQPLRVEAVGCSDELASAPLVVRRDGATVATVTLTRVGDRLVGEFTPSSSGSYELLLQGQDDADGASGAVVVAAKPASGLGGALAAGAAVAVALALRRRRA